MHVDRPEELDPRADVPRLVACRNGRSSAGQVGDLLAAALRSLESDAAASDAATSDAATSDAATSDGPGARIAVLDCGGGSGRFAVPLAVAGASVTVVDISVDALATLRRRAVEAGVAERVVPVQGDVEALADTVPAASFDLVLAHGILEAVDPLAPTFAAIAAAVRPGGLLSVLVGNPAAVVLARALAGDLDGAERELARTDAPDDVAATSAATSSADVGRAVRPGPVAVQRLCAEHGLVVEQLHGIGVFRDLVPGTALDVPGARETLARLDDECAQRSPFAEIAGRVHLLARRAGGPASPVPEER